MSTSHKRDRVVRGGRNRKKRMPTFSTEEKAKAWAEKNKISDYDIVNLKSADSSKKKIRISIN